jgi:hypothetical protein
VDGGSKNFPKGFLNLQALYFLDPVEVLEFESYQEKARTAQNIHFFCVNYSRGSVLQIEESLDFFWSSFGGDTRQSRHFIANFQ